MRQVVAALHLHLQLLCLHGLAHQLQLLAVVWGLAQGGSDLDGLLHGLVLEDDVEALLRLGGLDAYLLGEQQAQHMVGVLQLEACAGELLLAQANLEQRVACRDACLQEVLHLLLHGLHLLLGCLDGAQVVAHTGQLPVALRHLLHHVFLRELLLERRDVLLHAGQLVAVHDFPAIVERLYERGGDGVGAVELTDAERRADEGNELRAQCGNLLRIGAVGLHHLVEHAEGHDVGADVREVFGEGFLFQFRGSLHFEDCITQLVVVLPRTLLALFQGQRLGRSAQGGSQGKE